MLKMFWPGNVIGRPLSSSCSFPKAISEPANEIEPIRAERTVETEAVVARPPVAMWNSATRDERRRAAADPVEQGHHLRHRGHLHPARADEADRGADQRRDDDQRPVADAVEQQRARDREDHADAADPVPAPRVLGRGEEAQREDEADDRDEVEQPDQVRAGEITAITCPCSPSSAPGAS